MYLTTSPIVVVTGEEPDSDLTGSDQGDHQRGPWNDQSDRYAPPDHFEISLEFPPGQYYRRIR